MSLEPVNFVGRPLPELLAELAAARPEELLQGEVHLHSARTAPLEAVTLRPSSMMATTVAETDLPADHPDVDVPGVKLESYLGGGGQGWVYAGRVKATGHIVAVKVLRADIEAAQYSAAREALLCSRVRHRNVLRVFKTEAAGPFWVVIMELIQGPELQESHLATPQLRICLVQMAEALRELRKQRIVHCDIKPSNILLRRLDNSPVLVDFGVALDLSQSIEDFNLFGTPYYMAPEALRRGKPHYAWDAYSLGVTAAALLAVRIQVESLDALRGAKYSGDFERELHERLQPTADVRLRDWIIALLHKDPEVRLAAVETAANCLQQE
jgi:serine/threonine protein kinase